MQPSDVHRRKTWLILLLFMMLLLTGWSIARLPDFEADCSPRSSIVLTLEFPSPAVAATVAWMLPMVEQAVQDVPHARDMAFAANVHEASLIIQLESGTDPQAVLANVRNRLETLTDRLSLIMEREGITQRSELGRLIYATIESTDSEHDRGFLHNYSLVNLRPELQRIRGISHARMLGTEQRVMIVTMDRDRLRRAELTADDVVRATMESSMIGQPWQPSPRTEQDLKTVEYVRICTGRHDKVEQYENIILKAKPDGEILRLKDIGNVKSISFPHPYAGIEANNKNRPSAVIALSLLPAAKARDVVELVTTKLKEVQSASFPPGMTFTISDQLPAAWSLPRNGLRLENH